MNQVKEFQKKYKLDVDGKIGKNTFSKMAEVFNLSKKQLANFLGQTHHETGGFLADTENLNYGLESILRVFPKYFKTEEVAKPYVNNPSGLANIVYANRMGNGNTSTGDGYKFRGRGSIMITGENNYQAFSEYMKDPDILKNPDIVSTKYFWDAGLWFFERNRLLTLSGDINTETTKSITLIVNGGTNGLKDRIRHTEEYAKLIK